MTDSPRIEELRRRVQLDPASIAFAALAEEYRRAGRYEEAIATCTAGLQRHPAYLSAHVTLGRALLEIGQYDEAREELQHVLRLAPENLAAIRGLAEIHHRRGELPESRESFSQPAAAPEAAAPGDAGAPGPVTVPDPPVVPEAAPASIPVSAYAPAAEWDQETPVEGAAAAAAFAPTSAAVPEAPAATAAAEADGPPMWDYGFVDPPAPPAVPDPALASLESFLAAIVRARESAGAPRD